MSDLNKKLEDILTSFIGIGQGLDSYGADSARDQRAELVGAIPSIKQAFKDSGWRMNEVIEGNSLRLNGTPLMYGQEWYDRYIIEQNKLDLTWPVSRNELIAVGKKAAGIE